jgi:ribonuclease HI
MIDTVYVEGSLCQHTGAAGWGAVVAVNDVAAARLRGPLVGYFGTTTLLMELAAVQHAFHELQREDLLGERLTIAMRSTAALAILRWVFPDAKVYSAVEINGPVSLKKHIREFSPLYQLEEAAEKVAISLAYVGPNPHSAQASEAAKLEMSIQRDNLRRFSA